MAVYTEEIQLKDGVSPVAKAAQGALAELTGGLQAAQKGLVKGIALGDKEGSMKALADIQKYQDAIGNMKGSGLPGMKEQKPLIDPASMEMAKTQIVAAVGDIEGAFKSLASGDAKGAVTGLFDAVADLSKMLDLVVPGLGTAVSAVLKIAGGLAGITAGLIQQGAEFAIQATQEKQAMLSMFDAMGDGKVTGAELDDMLSDLSDTIGISKDQLSGYTKSFLQMGVTGTEQLKNLTLAAESANAIVGQGGAEAFTNMQKKIQLAVQTGGQMKLDPKFLKMITASGASIDDVAKGMGLTREQLKGASVDASKLGNVLTDAVIAKGAKPLERLGNTFESIKGKFMSNLGDMFEDMAPSVDGFMKQVRELFEIFGQANPSGQALKSGIQAFFSKTLELATKLVPLAKHFLLDLIIYGLQAYIALKPTIKAVDDFVHSAKGAMVLGVVWEAIKFAMIAIAVVIGVVIGLFTLLATASIVVGTAIWSFIGAIIAGTGYLVEGFVSGIQTAGAFLYNLVASFIDVQTQIYATLAGWADQAAEAAWNFVQGLVMGIIGGNSQVNDAVTKLAGGAYDAFTDFFGIHSPSTLMMEAGGHIGAGTAIGIGDASNDIGNAVSGVADTAAGAVEGKGGTGGASIQVINYITVEGAGKEAEEITDDMAAASWERVALAVGL